MSSSNYPFYDEVFKYSRNKRLNPEQRTKKRMGLKLDRMATPISQEEIDIAKAVYFEKGDSESAKSIIEKLLEEDDIESWDYSDSRCMICDQYFGWRCTNSPDGACHYHSTSSNGVYGPFYIKLINGEKYELENYDYSNKINETSDSCIFCHKPDERL